MPIQFHDSESRRTRIEHEARYQKALPLVSGRRVLDIGCAARGGSARLGEASASLIAVDVIPEQVDWARRHYPQKNVEYLVADVTALPFPAGAFETVVCLDVIEHVVNWGQAYDELARVIAPGGILILTTPNARRPGVQRDGALPNDHHVHEFEPDELSREVTSRGLAISEFRGFTWADSVDRKAEPLFSLVRMIDPFGVRRHLGWALRQSLGRLLRRASGAALDESLDSSLYREVSDPFKADYLWMVCEKTR